MTCDEARRDIHKALVKMADYQWKSARVILKELYTKLNETPADIHKGYGYWEEDK